MASIDTLKASDGTGNASVATVQSVRSPGATTLVVDTVQGINTKFHATMGTPHIFVDPVTSETITVISEATAVDFVGHVDGSNLEIDTIAPGFTDAGSAVNDIVIIKPTTQWADEVANVLEVSLEDDGTLQDDTVGTNQVVDESITEPKLGDEAVSNSKLKSGVGEPAGSWDSWTSTTTNITLGTGGSIVSTYKQIGKTVHFYIKVQLGTGGSLGGQPTFTPPVTMHSKYSTGNQVLGLAWYEDVGIGNSIGLIWVTAGNIRPAGMATGSTFANWFALSGSVPFTWGDGDYMVLASTYEAA